MGFHGVASNTAPSFLNWFIAFFSGYCSQFWQHTGEDSQAEVLLIPEAVGPPLNGPDFLVDAFHETEGHLVFGAAIGLDPVPVGCDHAGEALEWLQPLPA